MSKASNVYNPSLHITLYCQWYSGGKKIRYAFRYTGTLPDAIEACKVNVLGSNYTDFTIYALDYDLT